MNFKESKLTGVTVWKECFATWEDPEDGLVYIFKKVHIFLDVKDSLLNSRWSLKALKISKVHKARPLNIWVWRSKVTCLTGLQCLRELSLLGLQSRGSGSAFTHLHPHEKSAFFPSPWVNSELLLGPSYTSIIAKSVPDRRPAWQVIPLASVMSCGMWVTDRLTPFWGCWWTCRNETNPESCK